MVGLVTAKGNWLNTLQATLAPPWRHCRPSPSCLVCQGSILGIRRRYSGPASEHRTSVCFLRHDYVNAGAILDVGGRLSAHTSFLCIKWGFLLPLLAALVPYASWDTYCSTWFQGPFVLLPHDKILATLSLHYQACNDADRQELSPYLCLLSLLLCSPEVSSPSECTA